MQRQRRFSSSQSPGDSISTDEFNCSDRCFDLPQLREPEDPVEKYIEGLSDSKRLTLLRYLIFRLPTLQPSSRRWVRRPGRSVAIAGEKEVTEAYDRVLSELMDVLTPEQRFQINRTLAATQPDKSLDDLNRSIAVLTAAVQKSEELQHELTHVAELETGFPQTLNSLFSPKDFLYFHLLRLSPPKSLLIHPIPMTTTPVTGNSLLGSRFARPPQCRERIPITRRLTNDLLYLLSDRYNEQWSMLQALVGLLLLSFLMLFCLVVLSSLVARLMLVCMWFVYIQLASERRWIALDLACEEINRLTGRLGVVFHPQQVGFSLCIRIEFRHFQDIIRTKDLFALRGAEVIMEFEQVQELHARLPVEPVVPVPRIWRKGYKPNVFGRNVIPGGKLDDEEALLMEWKEWLANPSNVIETHQQ